MPLPGKPLLIAVTADTAGAVAAHFSGRTVRIVEQHAEIAAPAGMLYDHKSIRTDAEMPVAQRSGESGEKGVVQALLYIINNDKVISRSIHFTKSQQRVLLYAVTQYSI